MRLSERPWRDGSIFSTGFKWLLYPSPRSLLRGATLLLLLSGSGQPQQPPSSDVIRGRMCCPEGYFWGPTGCELLPTSTVFKPPIEVIASSSSSSLSPDEVTWVDQALECPIGYEFKQHSLGKSLSQLQLYEDGIRLLWFQSIVVETTDQFCIGLLPTGDYIGVTCESNREKLCTSGTTCLQKCCDEGQVLALDQAMCLPGNSSSSSFEFQTVSGTTVPRPSSLLEIYGVPECSSLVKLEPNNPNERLYLLQNGLLYDKTTEVIIGEKGFCLDYEIKKGEEGQQLVAMVCMEPGLSTVSELRFYFYTAGLLISAVFLLVAILFHLVIPKLRVMQNLCLLSHMISLLVADVGLVVGYIFSNDVHITHCVVNGFIVQYALLATFFWLNVMCYDVWKVIRAAVHCISLSSIQANSNRKFIVYSAYAWGGPAIFTLAAIILHFLPVSPESNLLRPGFGEISCWFSGELEKLAFFYGVISVLFVVNIVLLSHAILMLHKAGAAFQCCRKTLVVSSCNSSQVDEFWLRFRLLILMVLCWVTELLSWKIPPQNLWIVTDMINTLQGFLVFVIFICSSKNRDILKEAMTNRKHYSSTRDPLAVGAAWRASKSSSSYGTIGNSVHDPATTVEHDGEQGGRYNPALEE